MRPSSVETSEPACVNRKMLSTNNSTSRCFSSRKYSAMVSAESATRRRTPGGSSICPNTSAVFSITPDSVISRNRSLPSRVRPPTPAHTATPPRCSARARALADAGEPRDTAVLRGLAADHLLDDDGLAHAGAAEHADLAALHVRLQ